MARFYGTVGYLRSEESDLENHPGVWKEITEERNYYGDIYQNSRRNDQNGSIIDSPVINNRISIVADSYANEHIGAMKYVKIRGTLWKITNIELQRPRIILTIGGIYHGPES